MKSSLFWGVKQHLLVFRYQCIGTISVPSSSVKQSKKDWTAGPLKIGLIYCPKNFGNQLPVNTAYTSQNLRSHIDYTQVLAMFIKVTATTLVSCVADDENVEYSWNK